MLIPSFFIVSPSGIADRNNAFSLTGFLREIRKANSGGDPGFFGNITNPVTVSTVVGSGTKRFSNSIKAFGPAFFKRSRISFMDSDCQSFAKSMCTARTALPGTSFKSSGCCATTLLMQINEMLSVNTKPEMDFINAFMSAPNIRNGPS